MGQQGSYEAPASDWQTVAAPGTIGELSPLVAVRTFVTKIRPSAFAAVGNVVRAILAGQQAGDYTLSSLYIGPAVTALDHAWQFSAASQFTFDSGQALTQTLDNTSEEFSSDAIAFALDGSVAICIAGELPIGATPRYAINLGDEVITYFKDGVSEAASLAKGSGYTPLPGFSYLLARLEAANA